MSRTEKPLASTLVLLLLAHAACYSSGVSIGALTSDRHSHRSLGAAAAEKLEYPVWWFAPFWSTSGYGVEAISYVLSLLRSGLVMKEDIWITQHGDDPKQVVVDKMNPQDRRQLQDLEVAMLNTTRQPIIMCHSMPPSWGQRREDQLGPHACPPDPSVFRHAYLVGRTMFETDRLPPKFVTHCNAMHEVWVPSEFARKTFVESGVEPSRIVVLPQGIDTVHFDPTKYRPARMPLGELVFGSRPGYVASEDIIAGKDAGYKAPLLSTTKRRRLMLKGWHRSKGLVPGDGGDGKMKVSSSRARPYRFLSIFKWEPRKGWDVLLEAYLSEFSAFDNVELFIVTRPFQDSGSNFSTAMHQWATRILGPRLGLDVGMPLDPYLMPRIYVLQQHISDEQYPMLYKACDALVQPTRGEGWGRPQVEAMSMGLPVISTNWSGVTAYLDSKVGYPLHVEKLVEINDTSMEWFHGHRWAQPSVSNLRTLMRHVYRHPAEGRRKGLAARRRMVEHFSPIRLAEQLAFELRRIQRLIPHLPSS